LYDMGEMTLRVVPLRPPPSYHGEEEHVQQPVFLRFLCLFIGYFFGCILTADILSRQVTGASAFAIGTGNPGMANIEETLGARWAVIALAGDMAKTVVACLICSLAFPLLGPLATLYGGAGAILGHNLPFWHRFAGGKGVTVTCTVIFIFSPTWGLLACAIGLAAELVSTYACVGAVTITCCFTAFMVATGANGETIVTTALITAMMFYEHGSALRGIRAHTTPQVHLFKKHKS
jgi:glycerol-3-phosphate acyltransferase PlsY